MELYDGLARQNGAALRIDWFGNVGNSLRFGSEQRTLKVSCSPWRPNLGWKLGADDKREEIEIPIAILPQIRLGDVWQGGCFAESAPLTRMLFKEMAVNEQTAVVLPAGLPYSPSEGSTSYLLPFSAFNAHAEHTRSWVTRVQVDPGTVLVVPSLELFRFYFGATGSVLEGVMSGGDAEQRLYHAAYISRVNNAANVVLGMGMSAAAAPTVARIALDGEAKKAFFTLVKGGRIAGLNKTDWQPRMSFPFTGKTNLTVDGLWLDTPGQRTFVALRLIRCTYPHPFERLNYSMHDGQRRTRTPVSGERKELGPIEKKENKPKIVNQWADRSQAALEVYRDDDDADPFPYLKRTSIHRKSHASFHANRSGTEGEDGGLYAIGPLDAAGLPPAEIIGAPSSSDKCRLEPTFLAALRQAVAACLPGWEFCPLEDGEVTRRMAVPAPPGVASWCDLWVWLSTIVEYRAKGGVMRCAALGVAEFPEGQISVEVVAQLLGAGEPTMEQIGRMLFEPCWTASVPSEMNRDAGTTIAYWTTDELNALADELSPQEIAAWV
ncbi:hypothetical protein QTI51_22905 [Variovorax sp. J22G73]|uniref:hypothetical protein n=1 Tax=unclassified Variovorax TaxID=663243 RepID=UPI002577E188|nr:MULTISPECIES: hypothetical protein [unclassified Variovorax]MDM0007486.1 hypothetical protein [Variovorax sp. J22R203]MDM0100154.1 hypothetical protein [Variovorax sp. J22G73]